jgi:integral membrane sensor domain MASE1
MSSTEKKKAGSFGRVALQVFLTGVAYYVATEIAWALCFPNSKVSLLFPPHAVLVVILLLVPVRHWWAYTLATVLAHFVATQQAHWPVLYALHCEAFDAVQNVLAAAGIRLFIKSPLKGITLRDALVFVLIAVIIVPFGTAFWGAAFTVSNHFGTNYWIEWRNLGISNGVTAVVLVPALLLAGNRLSRSGGRVTPARMIEGSLLALGIVMVGTFVFATVPGRTGDLAGFTLRTDPAAHLGGVAFRTERNQRGHAGGHVSSDLGGDARTWSVSTPKSGGKCARLTDVSHRHGHSTHVPKRAVGGRKAVTASAARS